MPNRSRVLLFALLAAVLYPRLVSAYTPNDPVVTQMVDRGIKYLESLEASKFETNPSQFAGIAGETVLVAYAHYKCRHDPEAPLVKRGISVAQGITRALEAGQGEHGHKRNYEIAVCILLFAEVSAERFHDELLILQNHLLSQQFSHGGFGYPGDVNGDVSQTQYALLAIWTLDRNGIPLDYNRVVNTIQWLLRVQSKNGGWPYHGEDPGPGRPLIHQPKVDLSMALAGGSSVLIGGDALRLWGNTMESEETGIPGLPEAIKVFKEDTNKQRRRNVTMSEAPIKRAIQMMEVYRQNTNYKRSALDWYYYQMYTLERYESFVEIANGLPKDESPQWYDDGVEELKGYQGPDGGWTDRSKTQGPVSTSFALLFLIRSTQQTIFSSSSGSLQGGYGLPKDTTDIRVEGTQIKGRPIAAQVTDMLDILEQDGADDTAGMSIPENLQLPEDPDARSAQLDRLERLVRGSQSWQARRVAAKLLGRTDELRVVPSLIYALSDPDESVRRYARDGLRFISRKFDGFGMSDDPGPAEIEDVQRKWRDWYRTIDPNHVFLDYDL